MSTSQPQQRPIRGQWEAVHQGLKFQRTALLVITDDLRIGRQSKERASELKIAEESIRRLTELIDMVEVVIYLRFVEES